MELKTNDMLRQELIRSFINSFAVSPSTSRIEVELYDVNPDAPVISENPPMPDPGELQDETDVQGDEGTLNIHFAIKASKLGFVQPPLSKRIRLDGTTYYIIDPSNVPAQSAYRWDSMYISILYTNYFSSSINYNMVVVKATCDFNLGDGDETITIFTGDPRELISSQNNKEFRFMVPLVGSGS